MLFQFDLTKGPLPENILNIDTFSLNWTFEIQFDE